MVRVLEYDVGAGFDDMPDDAFIERVIPRRGGLDDDAARPQRLGQCFEMALLIGDDFGARLFE